MPDIAAVAGAVASILTAGGALAGRLAGNRREATVRSSLENDFKHLRELNELDLPNASTLVGELSAVLSSDLEALTRIVQNRNREKHRNYASLLVAIFLAAILSTPLWFLWRPMSPWAWAAFVVLSATAIIFLIAGLFACYKEPDGS